MAASESELQKELRLSEERFRLLVEQAPEAIVVSDANLRRIADANKKAEELFGCSREELIRGGPQRFYAPNQPGGADIAQSMSEHNLRALRGEDVIFERIVRGKTGKETHCEVRLSLLPSREGKLLRASFIDITSRVRAEEAIRSAKEAAEAAHRTKSEFLDIAAHELRTPLTSLTLSLQMAQKQSQAGHAPDPSLLDRAVRQVKRLNGLVNDLLDVSRLERGVLELRLVPVDLGQLISDTLDDFRRLFADRTLLWTPETKPIQTKMDATRFQQVLSNLLDNAVKYSLPGSPIEVKTRALPNGVRVEVTDQGPGISPAEQAKLFEPFARGQASLHQPGLGLGLYICRRIAELHGGSLNVQSEAGKGSTFCFDLPVTSCGRNH